MQGIVNQLYFTIFVLNFVEIMSSLK